MSDSSVPSASLGDNERFTDLIGQSFGSRDTGRRIGDAPVYGYRQLPGLPPVRVTHLDRAPLPPSPMPHAHDFLVLGLIVSGAGGVRLVGRDWPLRPGDLFLVAPGEVIDVEHSTIEPGPAEAWTVAFPPEAIEPAALRAWRAHPLLAPFVRAGGGIQRIPVPAAVRDMIIKHYRNLDRELRDRGDGFGEAVHAHLTLLLVDVLRLAADIPGGLRWRDEPLLAEVFTMIENRFAESISLRDVASAVAISPAHLTTVVRQKTGRTVQQWLTERRMIEARRLLAASDLTVAAIAARIGFRDAGYFGRIFRREHGVTPQDWRAGAPAS